MLQDISVNADDVLIIGLIDHAKSELHNENHIIYLLKMLFRVTLVQRSETQRHRGIFHSKHLICEWKQVCLPLVSFKRRHSGA